VNTSRTTRLIAGFFFLLSASMAPSVQAQQPSSALQSAGVPTRHFRLIEGLETELQQSLSEGHTQAQQTQSKVLSPVFSLQTPDGRLQDKSALLGKGHDLGALRLLHLHEVSGALIATLQTERDKNALVIDVWQSLDGNTWQLRLRILPSLKP
jgi:hypothetical protein